MDTPDALAAAATGMRVQADTLDIIAHNLANASTTGYRARAAAFDSFEDELRASARASLAQGPLRRTDVPTDLALVGPGYFAVATPEGVRYTRNGQLTVDPRGYLTDARGNQVLGSLGAVHFPQGARIDVDGRVVRDGNMIDRLRVVIFDDTSARDGRISSTAPADGGGPDLVQAPAGSVPTRSNAQVRAGFLEDSGVDAISEMTSLIAAQRAYEANQKSAQRTDESLRRLVTEVPSVRS